MLKIGDFSKFGQVPVKTLRYYDDIGLLKPVMVDQYSGYRYYSAEQLPRLHRIVSLKNLGLSLDEIALALSGLEAGKLLSLFREKQQQTRARLLEDENRLGKLEEWLKLLNEEGIMPEYDVVLKKVESVRVVSLREVIPNYGEIGRLYNQIFPFVYKNRIQISGPTMAIYYDSEYREKDADVEAAVPIMGSVPQDDRIKMVDLPAIELAATIIHKGSYENFSQTYKALMSWVESNGYQISGPNREVYLQGPGQQGKDDPAKYITEIQLPVKK